MATLTLWGHFAQHLTYFRVPREIDLARTFILDDLEAPYIDSMTVLLAENRRIATIHDVPLFANRDSLFSRFWNAFNRRMHHAREADVRVNDLILAPFDSYETPLTETDRLRELYPQTPAWLTEALFPHGVHIPLPPSCTTTMTAW